MANMNLREVAKAQKLFIWAIMAQVGVIALRVAWLAKALPPAATFPLLVVSLAVGVATLVCLVMLMGAMRRPLVWIVLGALSQFIPLVGLLVLVVVNQRATRALQEGGMEVGIMGARA